MSLLTVLEEPLEWRVVSFSYHRPSPERCFVLWVVLISNLQVSVENTTMCEMYSGIVEGSISANMCRMLSACAATAHFASTLIDSEALLAATDKAHHFKIETSLRLIMHLRPQTRINIVGFGLATAVAVDAFALAHGLAIKLFWAYLSVALTLAGYAIYLSQMYPENPEHVKKPQPLSWVGFGFLTGAGWLIQAAQGGKAGSWCLGITAVACFIIGIWSWARFGFRANKISVCAAGLGVSLFVVSFFTRKIEGWATISAICATLADLAFYEPTFKNAWRKPQEESVTNFAFNSAKCLPALLALGVYSVATMIYLIMLMVVNGCFSLFLVYRRKQLIALAAAGLQS